MKTNRIYVAVAIAVVILLAIFWDKSGVREVEDGGADASINTSTNTSNSNSTSGSYKSLPGKAPSTGGTSISKPVGGGTTPGSVPVVPTLASLNGSIFKLTSYNGTPVVAGSKYTLSFEGGSLNAKFCNSMGGTFVLDGSLIKATNLSSTMMYCSTPSNLMEIESAFGTMLNFGAMIYQSGNTLILSSSKGAVMVFAGF